MPQERVRAHFEVHLWGGSALVLEVGETQGTCGYLQALAVLLCPLPWEMKQKRRSALGAFYRRHTAGPSREGLFYAGTQGTQAGAEGLW